MQSKDFDKVDAIIAKGVTNKAVAKAAESGDPKAKLKAIWIIAKPVLEAVKGLLFFKPKWANTISDLITGIDAVLAS